AAAIAGSGFGTLALDTVTINTTNAALSLATGTATATFTAVTSTGGTNNVSLTGVAGTLDLGGGAFSGATSDAFVVNGGTAVISYAGTINNAAAQSVNIASKTGGSATFNGAVSGSGKGVLLSSNTGSTVTFAGGISLSTGAN